MKCNNCGEKIEVLYLDKIKGTYIDGKAYCNECQRDMSNEDK